MKFRVESNGYHFYDRISGYHLLLDEVSPSKSEQSVAPSLVSIALTNVCDLACDFCYAPKSTDQLSFEKLISWCKELDDLGTLEVAFGGGEPTLYKKLPELCKEIWKNTNLGISITTHGHKLKQNLIDNLVDNLSIVRFSIDAPEPFYAKLRGRKLSDIAKTIDYIKGKIPVGINTVVNNLTLQHLEQLAIFVKERGIDDWLLLPEIKSGEIALHPDQWLKLSQFIKSNCNNFRFSVSYDARPFLIDCPLLFDEEPLDDYAHISADGYLKQTSYQTEGINLEQIRLAHALNQLKSNYNQRG